MVKKIFDKNVYKLLMQGRASIYLVFRVKYSDRISKHENIDPALISILYPSWAITEVKITDGSTRYSRLEFKVSRRFLVKELKMLKDSLNCDIVVSISPRSKRYKDFTFIRKDLPHLPFISPRDIEFAYVIPC
mgnify:CR=1 FL=1